MVENKNIEVFNSGYSQVQAYLDALEIEKSYEDSSKEEPVKTKEQDAPQAKKRKLTNKEKEALKTLPQEIEKLEENISKLEEEIGSIDYSSLDAQGSEKLNKLVETKDNAETELLEKYELLEELEKYNS